MGEGIGNNKEPVGSNDIYTREATKVEVIGVTTNLALFIFKLLAGILGKSGAMVSDAIHTASDVFADLIAITGLQLSKKEEDKEHPYGHEKIECIFTDPIKYGLASIWRARQMR